MAGIEIKKKEKKGTLSTKVEEKTSVSDLLNTEISFLEKKFGPKEKEAFYSEMSLLLATGVDIKTAFDIIIEDFKNKKHKQLTENIRDAVISGKSIFEALSEFPKVFTKYEVQSIKIGEESGKLPEVLNELGLFYKSGIQLKRQIVGVLTYPVVVIGMAILIVFFMLIYVVPVFSEVFKQTGGQLPDITLFLIKLSDHAPFFFYCLIGIIFLIILIHKTQSTKDWYRKWTSTFLLKIPVVNKLIQKIYLARFAQSMKLLMGARVMINDALELVANMIEYYPIEKALIEVKNEVVNEGKLLNESLARFPIFPSKLVALIKLSEEVNAPEVIFSKLHEQYSAEIEHQQAVLGKLIEPFFIIILGLFVGFILVAMYLPMFEMSTGSF